MLLSPRGEVDPSLSDTAEQFQGLKDQFEVCYPGGNVVETSWNAVSSLPELSQIIFEVSQFIPTPNFISGNDDHFSAMFVLSGTSGVWLVIIE